jgi:hypothetical protein
MLLTQVRPDRIDLGRRGTTSGKKSRGATSANFLRRGHFADPESEADNLVTEYPLRDRLSII